MVAEAENQLSEKNARIAQLQKELAEKETQMAQNLAQSQVVEQSLKAKSSDSENLSQQLKEKETAIAEARTRIEALELELATANSKLEDQVQAAAQRGKEEAARSEEVISALQKSLQVAEAKSATLEQDCQQFKQLLAEAYEDAQRREAQLKKPLSYSSADQDLI